MVESVLNILSKRAARKQSATYPVGSKRSARYAEFADFVGIVAFVAWTAVSVLTATFTPQQVHASCNIIPGAARTFRSELGWVDRPFAEPGAWVEISLDSTCHGGSGGFSAAAEDHTVTVAFNPPGGDQTVIVLAEDCVGLTPQLDACTAAPSVVSTACIESTSSGADPNLAVVDRGGIRYLRFRFPDTDTIFDGVANDRSATGPATIAIADRNVASPTICSVAGSSCAAQTDLLACVDELYSSNGTCDSSSRSDFSHFTALPRANDYQELCSWPSPPCLASADEIRMTVDRDGNLLIPMIWDGILVSDENEPVATMLRGSTTIEPFAAGGGTIELPSKAFLTSYAPEGAPLPPILQPEVDPQAGSAVTLFGSADASHTILRIARRSRDLQSCVAGIYGGRPCESDSDCDGSICEASTCTGGANIGLGCASDTDCPDAECGPSLFDLSDRLDGGRGPVLIPRYPDVAGIDQGVCESQGALSMACTDDSDCPLGAQCVAYSLETQNAVPLDGIIPSPSILALVASEVVTESDLNGDTDMVDHVVMMRDAATGVTQPLGSPAQCAGSASNTGRAVELVSIPPFTLPAVSVSDDVMAFLESESAQGACDSSEDGDTNDSVLRVFQLGLGERTDSSAPATTTDPSASINSHSIVATPEGVYFRTSGGTLSRFDAGAQTTTEGCEAVQSSVSDHAAAFLRPESTSSSSVCAAGSLNTDTDTADLIAYRWTTTGIESLARAATSVRTSDTWTAALISEADEGASGSDINADGDTTDTVVAVHAIGAAPGNWIDVGIAAEELAINDASVAFLASEADEFDVDQNADGDSLDRTLAVYDADTGTLHMSGQSAIEFALGSRLVAFRTAEAEQGTDLNGDGNLDDEVLQVYDPITDTISNTGQTAIPCNQSACDPTTPYQVLTNTVRFLTDEALEGEDLNLDGDSTDIILQIFNAALAFENWTTAALHAEAAGAAGETAAFAPKLRRTMKFGTGVVTGELTTVGAIGASAQLGSMLTSASGAITYAASASMLVSAADTDGDELPDPFDNCPTVANILQSDRDRDGLGDACEPVCGDGLRQPTEQCDGESFCASTCVVSACGDPIGASDRATNALFILSAAAGSASCDACVCDLNGSGSVTASDALAALHAAVGLDTPLACPVCELTTRQLN